MAYRLASEPLSFGAIFGHLSRTVSSAILSSYFFIFMFGNFRLTAATTEECSGLPELLASASLAWEASGIGYFFAPFSTKSDFGSRFLFAAFSLAIAISYDSNRRDSIRKPSHLI
jgi:hypothetical protein